MKIKRAGIREIICILLIVLALILKRTININLPWNAISALIGTVFMYIGLCIRKRDILTKIYKNLYAWITLIVIGLYAVYTNDNCNFHSTIVGNPILMMVGAICISVVIISICQSCIPHNSILELLGRNTILILGFNYAINKYSMAIWRFGMGGAIENYTWWMRIIVDIVFFIPFIWLYNYFKNKLRTTFESRRLKSKSLGDKR